ncbi:MAG TPA: iron dicitrate transport regulator FecR, partial [Dongiaceae bacterium]|nr:iron dicitrate transport regulator FecR [Dongiaceae bacterium]
ALGTRFNVLQGEDEVWLDVYQGAVAIGDPALRQVIPAGQQACVSAGRIRQTKSADAAREAWTHGMLLADNITLEQVVAQLRRYRHGYIGLADEVAGLQVYGNFPLQDAEQVLTMLTQVLPVKVSHTLPWWVSIEADHGKNT